MVWRQEEGRAGGSSPLGNGERWASTAGPLLFIRHGSREEGPVEQSGRGLMSHGVNIACDF